MINGDRFFSAHTGMSDSRVPDDGRLKKMSDGHAIQRGPDGTEVDYVSIRTRMALGLSTVAR